MLKIDVLAISIACAVMFLLMMTAGCQSHGSVGGRTPPPSPTYDSLSALPKLLTRIAVEAPNHGTTVADLDQTTHFWMRLHGITRQLRVPVERPFASISVWIVDPPEPKHAPSASIRGTILLLHGYRNEKFWMLRKAKKLASLGYRAVLVDHRGHGASTGDWMTFGVQESADLVAVTNTLADQSLLEGPLGVWGISYGASTAIMYAARDDRVKAVVAVAPYASFSEILPHYIKTLLPVVSWSLSENELRQMTVAAGEIAGFDPSEADVAAAATRTRAPILLLHGRWDVLTPSSHSVRIHRAASSTCKLELLPVTGHVAIYFDVAGRVARESADWFETWPHKPAITECED